MLVGHLAAALGSKRVDARMPLGAAIAAAFGLDLLWPILLLLGVESVRVHRGDTAFTNLTFVSYPWSHSLVTAIAWSVLGMLAGRRVYRSWRVGAVLGGLLLSHWVLDFISHRPDLPLWPEGPLVGLGLWNSIAATIVVEGSLLAAGLWIYLRSTSPADRIGGWALSALVAVTGLIWVSQPWTPPPPSASAVAWGALILWLLPPWGRWIDAHRTSRS